jgi:hypothetical protein
MFGGRPGAYLASASGTSTYDISSTFGANGFVVKNSQALMDSVITRSATAALRVGNMVELEVDVRGTARDASARQAEVSKEMTDMPRRS